MDEFDKRHLDEAPHLVWESMGGETLYDARIFRLKSVRRRAPDGTLAPFFSLDAPDWVTVVPELPITKADGQRFLMVRQYRHGAEKVGLEFPAGIIDPGETPAEAAARELLEETGYTAGELVEIGSVSPNPAFMTNTTHTFLARDLELVSGQELDEHEILDFHEVGLEELRRDIGIGPYASAITVHAWYFYLKAIGKV
jgi:ADP-ribose pyrophosphatase